MSDDLYFARANDGSIKVGRSSNIPLRMAQLRCPEGERVELIRSFECLGKYERTVHRALAESALGGEWFSSTDLGERLAHARNGHAMLSMIGVVPRNVRPPDPAITDKDKADLAEAARMVADGKALKVRVQGRIRQRRKRLAEIERSK